MGSKAYLEDLLSTSSSMSKIFTESDYDSFISYSEKLLSDAMNSSELCDIRVARFLIWEPPSSDESKYKIGEYERTNLIFPSKKTADEKKLAAAEFMAYINLSEMLCEELMKQQSATESLPGITRILAHSFGIEPSFSCLRRDLFSKTWSNSFPLNKVNYKNNEIQIFRNIVKIYSDVITNPSSCQNNDNHKVNLRENDEAKNLVSGLASYKPPKDFQELAGKVEDWPGFAQQFKLLGIWIKYINENTSGTSDAFWVFPSSSNSMTRDKIKYHGAIWMIPEKHSPEHFSKWHLINKEIFIRGFWAQKAKETIEHSTKAAVTAIMARNFSHNIGSHVLSTVPETYLFKQKNCQNTYKKNNECNAECKEKVVKSENIAQTMDFFSYVQKRMDLIARMVGGTYTASEPMFFVGNVLSGFLKQDLLLNHLISDQGNWQKAKISFQVCMNDEKITFLYDVNEKKWLSNNNFKDILVAIPDGEIGCQAFYLFLESMMRNSAKYGRNRSAEQYQITIKLEEQNNYYKITVCDNLSLCNGNLTGDIRRRIQEDIVDPAGALNAKSLGIAEMREACGFLIRPFGDRYPAANEGNKKYPLWAICPGPDECHQDNHRREYPCEVNNCCNHLAYAFNLMKPQMVAIVGKKKLVEQDALEKYGCRCLSMEDLRSTENAYQFVLIYVTNDNIEEVLKQVYDHHKLLPFRTMLVGENIKLKDSCQLNRRFVLCPPDEICLNAEPERLILSVYEAWIRNRWLKSDYAKDIVNLIISFDRHYSEEMQDKVFERYKSLLQQEVPLKDAVSWKLCKAGQTTNGDLHCATLNEGNEVIFQRSDTCNSKILIYDNHNAAKRKLDPNSLSTDFLQEIGSKNKKIFETLASPPTGSAFTFQYFILGLLEAALTKVIIIDERVALSCIKDKKIDKFNELNEARCYPIFNINDESLNEAVKTSVSLIKANNHANYKKLCGIKINNDINIEDSATPKNEVKDADFIVVHYGLIETTRALQSNIDNLFKGISSVVITSGRGPGTFKKDANKITSYPFLEASILHDNIVHSVSKYHLVKALMSVKGGSDG